MHKRYLDCNASEIADIGKQQLLEALRASEGRILVSETIGVVQPMLLTITNAELAASQGADLLLLNLFDVEQPQINGLPDGVAPTDSIRELKRLTGRAIGVNLEPVDPDFSGAPDELWGMGKGRLATVENALALLDMGAKFIVLTGNPGNGISNRQINHTLREIHAAVGERMVLILSLIHI